MINLAGALGWTGRQRRPTWNCLPSPGSNPPWPWSRPQQAIGVQPAVWIQMSTLAYFYGDPGNVVLGDKRPGSPLACLPGSPPSRRSHLSGSGPDVQAGRMITLRTAVVLDGRSPAMKRLTDAGPGWASAGGSERAGSG